MLFRHVSADVSIQFARIILVLIGVFPAILLVVMGSRLLFSIDWSLAAIVASVPLLLEVQTVIPLSFNSSYTIFDIVTLALVLALIGTAQRTQSLPALFVIVASVIFLISESMSNAPFLVPAAIVFCLMGRYRELWVLPALVIALMAVSVRVFLQITDYRMGSTPGVRSDFDLAGFVSDLFANTVLTTNSIIGLSVAGSILVVFATIYIVARYVWSGGLCVSRRVFLLGFIGTALFYVPLVGFTYSADVYQIRYALYSHYGVLMILISFAILMWSELKEIVSPSSSEGELGAILFSEANQKFLSVAALALVLVFAHGKLNASSNQIRVNQWVERLSNYFNREPARAIRATRTHQYLLLNESRGPRSGLMPLATSNGYVRHIVGNPRGFGWVGAIDSCGDPFGENWSYWGRDYLPASLSSREPIWVVRDGAGIAPVVELSHVLAADLPANAEALGNADWRLWQVGDRQPVQVATGSGEPALKEVLLAHDIDVADLGLRCGVTEFSEMERARGLGLLGAGSSLEVTFTSNAWRSTGEGGPTSEFISEGIVLRAGQRAISREGLLVEPGETLRLTYTLELPSSHQGLDDFDFRVGPVTRSEAGEIVNWWSINENDELLRQAIQNGQRSVTSERVIVVSAYAVSAHIAFSGPPSEEGVSDAQIIVRQARLERVDRN